MTMGGKVDVSDETPAASVALARTGIATDAESAGCNSTATTAGGADGAADSFTAALASGWAAARSVFDIAAAIAESAWKGTAGLLRGAAAAFRLAANASSRESGLGAFSIEEWEGAITELVTAAELAATAPGSGTEFPAGKCEIGVVAAGDDAVTGTSGGTSRDTAVTRDKSG